MKYFVALFAAVVLPLLGAGVSEAWFGYRDQRARLDDLLHSEARLAAAKIQSFLESIRDQLGWTVQLPLADGVDDRQKLDAFRLLRQVPAVVSLTLIDAAGKERLFVSRVGLNRIESGIDRSAEPAVIGARSSRVWFSPVTFFRDSEPFMAIAVAGNRSAVGLAVAEVNLKFIWDVISAIRVGRTGDAFVLDQPGRLVAYPDISLVLRADEVAARPLQTLRTAILARAGADVTGQDLAGHAVVAALAQVPGVDWTVVVKQPLAEAFRPIYDALWRTMALMVAGSALAAALAYWLAHRMIDPIRLLEAGVASIGAGHFEHRIDLATGDELERLADRFNDMAGELALSKERSERISRLKRFLAPQVAELIDQAGGDDVLEGQRVEVVVVFCDLRGFTAFSAKAEPDTVMSVLGDYYDALGRVITDYRATLTHFTGDGMMVLLNAPVPCPDPAFRAAEMACDMQRSVQTLLGRWRALGHGLGFGIGLAMGPATVGRIGSEGRLDYTAIGTVVNLASRICSTAKDAEILIDRTAAAAVGARLPLVELHARALRGFERHVALFAVRFDGGPHTAVEQLARPQAGP